uniref:hypothetical protein n=1 Tax=Brevibacterium casei TaxID=33889 RepID=UPI0013C2A152
MHSNTPRRAVRSPKTIVFAIFAVLALFASLAFASSAASAAGKPPAGTYTGSSDAYNGATVELVIDKDGNITEFDTESYIQCGLFPTAMQWTGIPKTAVTADVPFDLEWLFNENSGGAEVQYRLENVVIKSDGTASGEGYASMPSLGCQGYRFNFTAKNETPTPSYDPKVSVSPGSVTVSELADPGVTVSGSGFPADADVVLNVAGGDVETKRSDASGNVSFVYKSSGAAEGEKAVKLTSGQWSASSSFTVTADPVVYEPKVSVSPGSVTVSELADPGVTVSGSGFPADADVVLNVAGGDVETKRSDASGNVSFVYKSSGAAEGEKAVKLTSGQWSASSSFTVTADPVVYEPKVSVSPGSVTVSELADPGVTVSGSGFPADADVVLNVAGGDVETKRSDASGNVSFVYKSAGAAEGEKAVKLTSGQWSASSSFTVT